jgi:hypothetical protein
MSQLSDDRYLPNERRWSIGNIVLHTADSKHPKMFMRVTGYTSDNLCQTVYINKVDSITSEVYENDIRYLLDIAKFGFNGSEDADAYERVRLWNFYCPVGTEVQFTDDIESFKSITRSKAWLLGDNTPVVLLDGKIGGYMLNNLTIIRREV